MANRPPPRGPTIQFGDFKFPIDTSSASRRQASSSPAEVSRHTVPQEYPERPPASHERVDSGQTEPQYTHTQSRSALWSEHVSEQDRKRSSSQNRQEGAASTTTAAGPITTTTTTSSQYSSPPIPFPPLSPLPPDVFDIHSPPPPQPPQPAASIPDQTLPPWAQQPAVSAAATSAAAVLPWPDVHVRRQVNGEWVQDTLPVDYFQRMGQRSLEEQNAAVEAFKQTPDGVPTADAVNWDTRTSEGLWRAVTDYVARAAPPVSNHDQLANWTGWDRNMPAFTIDPPASAQHNPGSGSGTGWTYLRDGKSHPAPANPTNAFRSNNVNNQSSTNPPPSLPIPRTNLLSNPPSNPFHNLNPTAPAFTQAPTHPLPSTHTPSQPTDNTDPHRPPLFPSNHPQNPFLTRIQQLYATGIAQPLPENLEEVRELVYWAEREYVALLRWRWEGVWSGGG